MKKYRLFLISLAGFITIISAECKFEKIESFLNTSQSLRVQCDTVVDISIRINLVKCIDSSVAFISRMGKSLRTSSYNSIGDTLKEYSRMVNGLKSELGRAAMHPIARLWYQSLMTTVGLDSREVYGNLVDWQLSLLERKYFGASPGEANIMEGYLNSHLKFTRTLEINDNSGRRMFGVSPYEVTVLRIEPTVLWNSGDVNAGGIASVGVTRHLFPKMNVSSGCEPEIDETFMSAVIKSIGVRIGVGAYSTKPRYMAGAGFLVRSVVLWGLIDVKDKNRMFFGMSTSIRGIANAL